MMNLKTVKETIEEYKETIGGVENYRDFNAINYSTLQTLDSNPKKVNIPSEDTDYFTFGSLVDDLICGSKEIKKKYAIAIYSPKPQMKAYVEALAKGKSSQEAYDEVGFKKDTLDKVKERYKKEGVLYSRFLKDSEGKKIVTLDDFQLATSIALSFISHSNSKKYFELDKKFEKYFQVPLLFTHKGNLIKVLLDMIIVNTEENTIIPIDFKTTGGTIMDFPISARKFRYDIQASLYSTAVKEVFENYTIEPFRFIVGSKQLPNIPLVYIPTQDSLNIGRVGGKDVYGNSIKGWEQLIQEYKQHKELDYWDLPIEVINNEGHLTMNIF